MLYRHSGYRFWDKNTTLSTLCGFKQERPGVATLITTSAEYPLWCTTCSTAENVFLPVLIKLQNVAGEFSTTQKGLTLRQDTAAVSIELLANLPYTLNSTCWCRWFSLTKYIWWLSLFVSIQLLSFIELVTAKCKLWPKHESQLHFNLISSWRPLYWNHYQ